ncbi:hypothetical protein FACS1894152_4630 [Bacilli bacterium]|nr:hypothetical protein FACS1894152_4630 [Bacilli bacterium]
MDENESKNKKVVVSKAGFAIGSKYDYETMRPDLSNSNIVKAVTYYVADNKDESAFQTCIGAYVCGSRGTRNFLEKKLNGIENGKVIKQAQGVLIKGYGLPKGATMADVEEREKEEREKLEAEKKLKRDSEKTPTVAQKIQKNLSSNSGKSTNLTTTNASGLIAIRKTKLTEQSQQESNKPEQGTVKRRGSGMGERG